MDQFRSNIISVLLRDEREDKQNRQREFGVVLFSFGSCLWKHYLNNGFRSSENYFDQFWSNRISVLLCDGRENIGKTGKTNSAFVCFCLGRFYGKSV